jgi:hypothetical protein
MVTEDNYIDWPILFVFLAFEETSPALEEFEVPFSFTYNAIDGDAFRRVIRDCLPEVIHFENRDLNHYPGKGDEDYLRFWDKLEDLLTPITTREDVRDLRKWGNHVRFSGYFHLREHNFSKKHQTFRRALHIQNGYSSEEAVFLTLSHIYYWRYRAAHSLFQTLEIFINRNTPMVNWVNSLYPERAWYKPSDTFMESCLVHMKLYGVSRVYRQFAQSLRNTFTRDRYQAIATKLVEDEKELASHLELYDFWSPPLDY